MDKVVNEGEPGVGRRGGRRWGVTWPVVAAAALLAACATPVPTASAVDALADLPSAWSGPAPGTDAPASLAAWWQRFDDRLLGDRVAQVLAHNTDLLSAQATLRQARASRDAALAAARPTLALSGSAQTSRAEGAETSLFKAGLDASWEADLFGARRAAVAAAEAGVQGSAASLGQVRVTLAAETVLAYLDLRSAQARLALAEQAVASWQRTRQITDWRVQAGLDSPLVLDQSRSALAQAQAALPALRTARQQAMHALAVLSGQPPAALQAELEAVAPLPQPPDSLALALPADTLRQRADVRAAEADVMAARATLAQAEAQRWPSLSLGGSLGLSALRAGSLASAPLAGSLLASLSGSLFDGGAARAAVDSRQAALQRSELAWRAAVLTALKEVENALVDLQGQRERQAALAQAVDSARRAADTAGQRYASGLIGFDTVLETQRSLIALQDSLALTRAAQAAAHVQLYKALGGGWQPDQGERAAATRRPAVPSEPRPDRTQGPLTETS